MGSPAISVCAPSRNWLAVLFGAWGIVVRDNWLVAGSFAAGAVIFDSPQSISRYRRGITSSRAHSPDNLSVDAITSMLREHRPSQSSQHAYWRQFPPGDGPGDG